jgi:hypothetical protein
LFWKARCRCLSPANGAVWNLSRTHALRRFADVNGTGLVPDKAMQKRSNYKTHILVFLGHVAWFLRRHYVWVIVGEGLVAGKPVPM